MVTASNPTGRLIVLRLSGRSGPPGEEPVSPLVRAIARRGERPVIAIDVRNAAVLTPAMADNLVAVLRREHGSAERAVFVVGSANAIVAMQFERVLREAGDPSRSVVHEAAAAEAWLGEVLTAPERAALRAFLAGG